MNTKMCRKCGIIKSVTEFHKGTNKQDNCHSYCKACAINGSKEAYRSLKQKEWMVDQANDKKTGLLRLLDNIKQEKCCAVCNENCSCCLVFHHINPDEKIECLSKLANTKNVQSVVLEINKCVVLCTNCHAKFHAGLISFDINKRCCVDLEYCKTQYEVYKQDIRRKKRSSKASEKYCICGSKITNKSLFCVKCDHIKQRKIINRPSLEQLQEDVELLGYCATGRKYGVTDNTVRKWMKQYLL